AANISPSSGSRCSRATKSTRAIGEFSLLVWTSSGWRSTILQCLPVVQVVALSHRAMKEFPQHKKDDFFRRCQVRQACGKLDLCEHTISPISWRSISSRDYFV